MTNKQLSNRSLHPTRMRYGQTVLCLILIAALCGCVTQQGKASQNRWISLFNGKNLEGWTVKIAGHELNDNYGNTALTHIFCYRSPVVASVKCYQKLEAYDGQGNQLANEKGIA